MSRRKTNPDFMTGVPELLVLRILKSNSLHGYAIIQSIKTLSSGKLSFGEGSIYPVLHRLEEGGILRTKKELVEGRHRVIYSITAKGKKRLEESHTAWQKVVESVDAIFSGNQDGSPKLA